jgi:hypothetical protein
MTSVMTRAYGLESMDVTDRQPNQPAPGKAGIGSRFAIGHHCPGLPEPGC